MNYKIGKSNKSNISEAVIEATKGIKSPKLILFFSKTNNFEEISKKIKDTFKESIVIGATTFAGFCATGAYKDTLLVVGIESGIECYGDILEEVDKYPLKYVDRISNCIDSFSDTKNTICFEISTALKNCEELVLSTFNSVLAEKQIPLVGGSSGNNGNEEKTLISFNGQVYTNGCAFVLIKNLNGKINLYRENIYKPTKHYFTATKVDERKRIVYEYDDKPAAKVIAECLNTEVDNLKKYLDSNPVGRIIGNDMYITANNTVVENLGMSYHARIYKNSNMVLLEPDNYKEVINNTLNTIKEENSNISFAIVINCLARSILFEKDGYLNEFATNMGSVLGEYVGFAGFGEQLNEEHFNQTMVVIVFE